MPKMGSKIPVIITRHDVNRIVTDLDEISEDKTLESKSDGCQPVVKSHRGRHLKNFSGNFPARRAKSTDGFKISDKKNVRELLEIKDEQIEQLVHKLTSLVEYNSRFSKENDRLANERGELESEIARLTKKIEEATQCEGCSKTREEFEAIKVNYDKHKAENSNLQNDIKMLKVLAYRLNVQIEKYQTFFREHKHKDTSVYKLDFDNSGCTEQMPEWGSVNSNILAPLLNAYEETIQEKTDIIAEFEREMSEFTGKLNQITDENEKVHKELDEMRKVNEIWTEERSRLQAQVDLFRNKADIQGKRADLGKEKLVEVMRVYEQKVQCQALDIERLQEAYARCRGELVSLRHLNEQPETVANGLKECQKLFEDLKTHHEKERDKLVIETTTLVNRNDEQQRRISTLEEDKLNMQKSAEKQKEDLTILTEKYHGLRQNIHRIRQSKELLRIRLKNVVDWSKGLEEGKTKVQTNWNDIQQIEAMLRQKEAQIKAIQAKHYSDMEDLQRKLRNREETLKKFLKDKTERK